MQLIYYVSNKLLAIEVYKLEIVKVSHPIVIALSSKIGV